MKPQVHAFVINNVWMALDVGSSNLFVLDEFGIKALSRVAREKGYLFDGLVATEGPCNAEAIAEVEELMSDGLLFAEDRGEEMASLFRERSKGHGPRALCLNVAHACNMSCQYCFASCGSYGAQSVERRIMPPEIAERAVDFLLEGWPGRRCEIDFFGGEPLLAWDTLVRTIEYGEKRASRMGKRLRFTCTTNGTLLKEDMLRFLDEHKVALVVSLDGRPAVHDSMRRLCKGVGSYARALEGARMVARHRERNRDVNGEYGSMGSYYIRGTYTARNLDFCEDVRHLVELGFENVSLEPVVSDPGMDFAITRVHLPLIAAEYDRLADFYLKRFASGQPFRYFHFELKLSEGPCLGKRVAGCGAAVDYMAVAPDGSLWPCHQFDGRDMYRLGDVWRGVTQTEIRDAFRRATPVDKPSCRECWARYLCGGGCHANAAQFNGDISRPWDLGCKIQKIRLERALYVQAMTRKVQAEVSP